MINEETPITPTDVPKFKLNNDGEMERSLKDIRSGAIQQLNDFVFQLEEIPEAEIDDFDRTRKKSKGELDRLNEVTLFVESILENCPDLKEYLGETGQIVKLTSHYFVGRSYENPRVGLLDIRVSPSENEYLERITRKQMEIRWMNGEDKQHLKKVSELKEQDIIRSFDKVLSYKRLEPTQNPLKKLIRRLTTKKSG